MDNILNLESMPFFRIENLMTWLVEFWATIRRLGSSDSPIEQFPVGIIDLD